MNKTLSLFLFLAAACQAQWATSSGYFPNSSNLSGTLDSKLSWQISTQVGCVDKSGTVGKDLCTDSAGNLFFVASSGTPATWNQISIAPLPDFAEAVTPIASTIFQSVSTVASVASYTVTQSIASGYAGSVTLSCASPPTGVTCAFSPSTVTGAGTSTMTVTASYSSTPGVDSLTVSGTDGAKTHTATGNSLTVWTGPVQQWLMSEGTSPMLDSSGNANNLTNANVTYSSITGLGANTATYNGSSSTTTAANHTNTNFTGTSPFTVCLWENQTSVQGADPAFVSTIKPGTNFIGWEMSMAGAGPRQPQFFLISNLSGNNLLSNIYSFSLAANTAYHFCVAYDGSQQNTGALGYIDGAVQAVSTNTNTLTASAANAQNVSIGARTDGTTPMLGGVADIRIFAYQLNATQIAALYAGGAK